MVKLLLTPDDTRFKFYAILEVLDQILRKYKVTYSLFAGSLIGCIRHGAMIPWDDDIDLLIFEEAEEVIRSSGFISELNAHSLNLLDEEDGTVFHIYKESDKKKISPVPVKISIKEFWCGHPEYNKGQPFVDFPLVDLFVYQQKWPRIYALKKFCCWEDINDKLYENEIFPLQKGMFGGNYYDVINQPNVLLERHYGRDCMSLGSITHFHKTLNRVLLDGSRISLNLTNEKRIKDIEYWDNFYSQKCYTVNPPSLFAKYVAEKLITEQETIIDLGCGDGRDSYFFLELGCRVLGVDASSNSAIIDGYQQENCGMLQFLRLDINELQPEIFKNVYIVYSRFLFNALRSEEEKILLKHLSKSLGKRTWLCIEARTIKDEMYGCGEQVKDQSHSWIYEGHYRRFIVPEEIKNTLEKCGFYIEEINISKGFAPYPKKNEDPECVRILAIKK